MVIPTEKHQNHEDGMDGNDYFFGPGPGIDTIIGVAGVGVKVIELGIAVLGVIGTYL